MNYFSRLADRSGLSASPRSAVTPMAGPAPAATSPGDHREIGDLPEVGDVPQPPETPASDAPATIAQPPSGPPFAIGPATTPTPFGPMGTMPATESEIRRHTREHIVAPARPHQIERKTMPPAPPERVASVPATEPDSSLRDQQSIAPLHPREIGRETTSAAADQIVSDVSRSRIDAEAGVSRSRMDAGTASNRRALSPQAAAVEPAIRAAEYDIEVPPRAQTQAATRQPAAGGERAVAPISSRLRPAQRPETEDIAFPALRMAPAAGRDREDRDTMARRHDRTATTAPRVHAGPGTRGASVEVRIGEVTLQVHAPPAPAAPQAPPRHGFAPHRHYLRAW